MGFFPWLLVWSRSTAVGLPQAGTEGTLTVALCTSPFTRRILRFPWDNEIGLFPGAFVKTGWTACGKPGREGAGGREPSNTVFTVSAKAWTAFSAVSTR